MIFSDPTDICDNRYFGLADELSINYLLQPKKNESDDSLKKRYTQIVKDTTSIMGTFSESAEILMADVLEKKGFILKLKWKDKDRLTLISRWKRMSRNRRTSQLHGYAEEIEMG